MCEALNLLSLIVLFIVFAFGCAGLVDLYCFSIGDPVKENGPSGGRIFSRVGMWLGERYAQFELVTRELKAAKQRTATTPKAVRRAMVWDRVNYYKLLGMCPRCVNMWASVLVFIIMQQIFPFSWWWLLPFIGTASYAISLVSSWRD